MKKEKPEQTSQEADSIRKLESLRYTFRNPQNILDSNLEIDDPNTYEWFEACVIRKIASVVFGKDALGKDTAIIKMVDPETKEKRDVYYTADETEVARLKYISEGKAVVIEVPKESPEDEMED